MKSASRNLDSNPQGLISNTKDFEGTNFFSCEKNVDPIFAAHDMLCKCYQTKYVLFERTDKKVFLQFCLLHNIVKTKSEFL